MRLAFGSSLGVRIPMHCTKKPRKTAVFFVEHRGFPPAALPPFRPAFGAHVSPARVLPSPSAPPSAFESPMYYTKKDPRHSVDLFVWSIGDSNPWPLDCQSSAIPTSPMPQAKESIPHRQIECKDYFLTACFLLQTMIMGMYFALSGTQLYY